jgi:hypothetical protein
MRNVNQKDRERGDRMERRGGWMAGVLLSASRSPLLDAPNVCGAPGNNRSNGNCASRQSALRRGRTRSRPSRIAAIAIVAFVVAVSVRSIMAQTTPRGETPNPVHLTKGGKKWVAATLRSLSLEEKVGQMLMGRCFLDYASFKNPDPPTTGSR